jgi:catechol 2,3-dioxygenase-like lactoylglutathione lyase family enzyme
MTVVKEAIPFFMVTSMEASLRFYVDGLGFTMVNRWIDEGVLRWCALQHGKATIMLQQLRRERPQPRPASTAGDGLSICFTCDDALAFYREVTAKGLQASRPFVGNAMWVTNLSDPDGYRLSFESPTDAPEESTSD